MPRKKVGPELESEKRRELAVVAGEVAQCEKCPALVACRSRTVFSDGTPMAELCFVGEAPGFDEDQAGVPFVGRAGQLLTKIIEACKLERQQVYICNVLKCRPPDNRTPQPDEMANCIDFLRRQIRIVKPRVLVAWGKVATAALMGEPIEKVPILKMRGSWIEFEGIPCMVTLHPAYLLRNPSAKREVWDDMKTVLHALGRPLDV